MTNVRWVVRLAFTWGWMAPALGILPSTCPSGGTATWIHVYTLDGAKIAAEGCPGDMGRWTATSHVPGNPDVKVCGRANSSQPASEHELYQRGGIVVPGHKFEYNAIRGNVGGYMMGSPDSFRSEEGRRGYSDIDSSFADGISLTRWDTSPQGRGREHIATYASGLSYNVRGFSYYQNGNCQCHGGTVVPPRWLGDDYFCDSGLRGGKVYVDPTDVTRRDIPSPENETKSCWDEHGGQYAICHTIEECRSKRCPGFFANSIWYANGQHDLMWKGAVGMVCRGPRVAEASDFDVDSDDGSPPASRVTGSFYHRTNVPAHNKRLPPSPWVSDAIEVRSMSGQHAVTGGEPGNEDTAIVEMDLWIHGCEIPTIPRSETCGNGKKEGGEICDAGPGNGFAPMLCSLACTTWNPPACRRFGVGDNACVAPPVPPVVPETIPGAEDLGSRLLPAWVRVAAVDYDKVFTGHQGASRRDMCGAQFPSGTLASAEASCPGDLVVFIALVPTISVQDCEERKARGENCPTRFKYVCGAKEHATISNSNPAPSSFKVAVPPRTQYAAVKGRVVTHVKGHMDAYLNVPGMFSDFSTSNCYKVGACEDRLFSASVMDSSVVRAPQSNSSHPGYNTKACTPGNEAWCAANGFPSALDSRYVDGISITYGDPYRTASPRMRNHIWTLAAGSTSGARSGHRTPGFKLSKAAYDKVETKYPGVLQPFAACTVDTCSFPGYPVGPKADPTHQKVMEYVTYINCFWRDEIVEEYEMCTLGNCRCHGGDQVRASMADADGNPLSSEVLAGFDPPSFVGGDQYCDSGVGAFDNYRYGNNWKGTPMFTRADKICVGGTSRDAAFWKERGGPGFFKKELQEMTAESIEFRLMSGRDSFYEQIGVAQLDLEVCVCKEDSWKKGQNMSAHECFLLCEGKWNPSDATAAEIAAGLYPAPQRNQLSRSLQTTGYVVFALMLAACFACMAWIQCFHKTREVRISQPFFLRLVIVGVFISSLAIPCITIDDAGETAGPMPNEAGEPVFWRLDLACQLTPWFYMTGFVVSFASLFAKMWRIRAVWRAGVKFKKVDVNKMFLLRVIGLCILVSWIVLLAWTLHDPLRWRRLPKGEEANYHGRYFVMNTVGKCDSSSWASFLVPLGIFQLSLYAYGCKLAYECRTVSTKYSNHNYISIAMYSNVQILIVSVPLMVVLSSDPSLFFVCKLTTVFLTEIGMLALMFVPIMWTACRRSNVVATAQGTDGRGSSSWIKSPGNASGSTLGSVRSARTASFDQDDEGGRGSSRPAEHAVSSPSST